MYSLYVAINRETRVTADLCREADEICTLVAIPYRRIWATYRSHFRSQEFQEDP